MAHPRVRGSIPIGGGILARNLPTRLRVSRLRKDIDRRPSASVERVKLARSVIDDRAVGFRFFHDVTPFYSYIDRPMIDPRRQCFGRFVHIMFIFCSCFVHVLSVDVDDERWDDECRPNRKGWEMARKVNPMGKSRKPGDAYITTTDHRLGWTWEVLKSYQVDGSKPYARAFCNVHGFATEMGDCYIADIGTDVVDFDATVFANRAEAFAALFGRNR